MPTNLCSVLASLIFTVAVLFLPLAAGCTSAQANRPKTYTVKGKVVHKDGTPVRGGAVEFRNTTDRTITMIGPIEEDGTFTISTLASNSKVAGAIAGEHEVTIIANDSRGRATPSIRYPKKIKVIAGSDNEIVLTLPTGPARP
jgi:hypothetical protein